MHRICGRSSSGRAPPCQGGGSEFEPRRPLQYEAIVDAEMQKRWLFCFMWQRSGMPAAPRFHRERRCNCLFPSMTPPVKMRLERSAERDKRENQNNNSANYAQSNAERILNRPVRQSTPKQRAAVQHDARRLLLQYKYSTAAGRFTSPW